MKFPSPFASSRPGRISLAAFAWALAACLPAGVAAAEDGPATMVGVMPAQVVVKRLAGASRLPSDDAVAGNDGDTGGFTVDVDVRAPVPRRVAYTVLSDFAHMAAFVPNVEKSEVLSRDGSHLRVQQQGRMRYGLFSVGFSSVRDVELLPDRILAKGITGTAKHMESELRFETERGDGASGPPETRFHYHAWIVPELGLPPLIGPAAVRHEVAEQFTAMVQEMIRRHAQAAH